MDSVSLSKAILEVYILIPCYFKIKNRCIIGFTVLRKTILYVKYAN